jgi:hypothetical protein
VRRELGLALLERNESGRATRRAKAMTERHVALDDRRSACLGLALFVLALFVSTQFGAVPRERIQAHCEN